MALPLAIVSKVVDLSREAVWEGLTNPAIVKQYFFGTDLITTWQPNTPILFRGEWEGKPYEDKGVVQHFTPLQSLSYSYKSSFDPLPDLPENYRLITYQLLHHANGIEIKITQEAADQATADHSASNWSSVLDGMVDVLRATKYPNLG
jgi:uncharacterized protein YndB with AHSA1/START domain